MTTDTATKMLGARIRRREDRGNARPVPDRHDVGDQLRFRSEIADALASKGIEVDRRRVELAEPIRRLGSHTVHVRFHRDVVAELTIEVQPSNPAPAPV